MIVNKDRLVRIALIFIIIVLMIFGISQCNSKRQAQNVVKDYKEFILKSDSLRLVKEGRYQKVVNDLNNQRDLNKKLKEENKELYKDIKDDNKLPISYTNIEAQPKNKVDTIIIRDTIKDGHYYKVFNDFYPNNEKPFITYKGEINNNSVLGEFKFNPFELDLVISEKEKGIFEADLNAPEWLTVNSLEVNSLPLKNIKKDNFDWMLGGAAGLNTQDNTPVFDIEGGFRYKESLFSIQGTSNKEIKLGFKKLF